MDYVYITMQAPNVSRSWNAKSWSSAHPVKCSIGKSSAGIRNTHSDPGSRGGGHWTTTSLLGSHIPRLIPSSL